MKRRTFLKTSNIVGASLLASSPILGTKVFASNKEDVSPRLPTIDELRKLAGVIVGNPPDAINVLKVADTIRPASVVVKGEDENKKMVLARTVYQLVYPKGTIMLDTGMDLETHRTFGKTEEPYFPENYKIVQKALVQADMIVLTHYHADHVAGLVRSPDFDQLAYKVWTTRDTADLMVNKPHKPTVHIAPEKVNKFNIIDFEDCMPLAPGVVIFKTPGHTTDSKMLYIRLSDGSEFIHSVDSGWSMENITKERMKNASWVHENEQQLLSQYKWLNNLMRNETNITVLCTHDNEQYENFIQRGVLGTLFIK